MVYPSIRSFVVIQFCVCFCPSVCLPVRILSVYMSVRPLVCPFVHLYAYFCVILFVTLLVCMFSFRPNVYPSCRLPSVCVCFCPSVCLPVRILSVYVSVCPSVCPFVRLYAYFCVILFVTQLVCMFSFRPNVRSFVVFCQNDRACMPSVCLPVRILSVYVSVRPCVRSSACMHIFV